MIKNKGGRPRLFKDTPEDIERWDKLMEGYIDSITYKKNVIVNKDTGEKDKKGNIIYRDEYVTDAEGNKVQELAFHTIPSFLGLVNYLGLDKDTVQKYGKMDGFSVSYKKVLSVIEAYTADLLQTKNNVAGVIFTLKNNFGWQDKKELEVTSKSKLEDFFNE